MLDTIFYFLDASYNILAAVDQYQSAIFTSRYYEPGDFEIWLPGSTENLTLARSAAYVLRGDKTTVCGVIEKVSVQTSAEEGNYIIVAGRDAACLLERRIVWKQTTYNGKTEKIIRNLIETAFISPEIAERTVSNLILGPELGMTGSVRVQYTGDTVLDAIEGICQQAEVGFRVDFDLTNKNFVFQLYRGVDRSFEQSTNAFVVFSGDFENIVSTTYEEDATNVKNVAQVAGEGQGNERVKVSVGTASGISRIETFINAQINSSNNGEIDQVTYRSLLRQDGAEQLTELKPTKAIDGEIAPNYQYIFGVDYNIGDIVQIENEYGYRMQPRIVEAIENWSTEGYTCIPTFEQSEN